MRKKNVLITGATSGFGVEIAKALSQQNMKLFVIARNPAKYQTLASMLSGPSEYIYANLENLAGVSAATQYFLKMDEPLDILINNAGALFPTYELTTEGIERMMAINYFAPFLFIHNLLPKLKETAKQSADARIINTSSSAHLLALAKLDIDRLATKKFHLPLRQYGRTKLAIMLLTQTLAGHLKSSNIQINSFHPGMVYTDIGKDNKLLRVSTNLVKPLLSSVEKGAETPVYLACSKEAARYTGEYFIRKKPRFQFMPSKRSEQGEFLYKKSHAFMKHNGLIE